MCAPPPEIPWPHTHTLSHTDWWIDSNTPSRICCLAFAGLLHIIQRHAHEHNYTACLAMAWKTTGETYQQFCLNSLHADKRTECESVLLLLLGRGAGLGLNSVPVVESSRLLKLSKYGSVSDPNAAELALTPCLISPLPETFRAFFHSNSSKTTQASSSNRGTKKQTHSTTISGLRAFTFVNMLCSGGLRVEKGETEEREERQSSPLGHHFSRINLCRL